MNRTLPSWPLLIVAAWMCLAPMQTSLRAEGPAKESVVKAAFLCNFAQFIEWPSDAFRNADAPFVIGIVGDDPFGNALEQAIRDKRVGSRPIIVAHFHDAAAMRECQILYVSNSENGELSQILQLCNDTTLTVGDVDNFTAEGGALRFLLEDNRVQFEINVDVIRKLRLKVSSKLLKLARIYGQ